MTYKVNELPIFDPADYLDSREVILAYIKEFLEDFDSKEFDEMLKAVVRSKYVQSIL